MWYLYLDESGDLGFDFVNKNPSKYFTVAILATSSHQTNKAFTKAKQKTLARKLNRKPNKRRIVHELKGSSTIIEVKRYAYKLIENERFGIYAVTLNKLRVFESLTRDKERTYNWVARQVLDQIPFEKANVRVQLVIDKCKGKKEIAEFNKYIQRELGTKFPPEVPVDITHIKSHESPGLQFADLFAWGIFQKYERSNTDWYQHFQDKINLDKLYLK